MRLFASPTTGSTKKAGNSQISYDGNSKVDKEACCSGGTSASSTLEGPGDFVDAKFPQHEDSTKRHSRGIIYFRPIKPEDRAVIQKLHELWFPVDYKSDFFDGLCNERIMPGTNQPLYSCVACFKELNDDEFEEMYEKRERESCSMSLFWYKEKHPLASKYLCNETNEEFILWQGKSNVEDDDSESITNDASSSDDYCVSTDDNANGIMSLHQQKEREKMKRFYSNGFRFDGRNSGFNQHSTLKFETADKEQKDDNDVFAKQRNNNDNCNFINDCGETIVGCVVGCFLSSSFISTKTGERDDTAALLVPDPGSYPEMFYIMTLGTARAFRGVGLGTILVNRVVDMIKSKQECGALYLHVITYNETAIKLYERLGFSRVKKIRGYYNINSVDYDCYLYARYFHGNNSDYLSNFAKVILRKMSGGLFAE